MLSLFSEPFLLDHSHICPTVLEHVLSKDRLKNPILILTTRLLPITTIFSTRELRQPIVVLLLAQESSQSFQDSQSNSAHLRIVSAQSACTNKRIMEDMMKQFDIREFYIVMDADLSVLSPMTELFPRCFVNTLEFVVKKKPMRINMFMFSAGDHNRTAREKAVNTDSGNNRDLSCSEVLLTGQSSSQDVFVSSINMYLRTYQNLYNLDIGFGADLHSLPLISFNKT